MMDIFTKFSSFLPPLNLIACFLFCWLGYRWYKNYNLPPGPLGLPFIGYLPFLGNKPHFKLAELANVYGDIFSIKMRSSLLICVNEHHLGKKLLNHPYALARNTKALTLLPGQSGFAGRNGREWQEQRRFAMHALRNLGQGKSIWETLMSEDSADFVKMVRKIKGHPFDFFQPIALSQLTNELALLFGREAAVTFDKNDIEVILKIGIMMNKFSKFENLSDPPASWVIKLARMLNYKETGTFISGLDKLNIFLRNELKKRLSDQIMEKDDDFIWLYIREMNERNKDLQPHFFTIDMLVGNLFVFLISAPNSTVIILSWLLLLMVKFPEVQKCIHKEIDENYGRTETIHYDDRNKLVYTMATIFETLRYISPISLLPARWVEQEFKFEGYTIPKGSYITLNVWSVHHNSKYFDEPSEFNPERFLDDKKSKLIKLDYMDSFSVGKRNCPGESTALMNIFLYFANIMQSFSIQIPEGKKVNLNTISAAALMPYPQKLCFVERM